VHIYLRDGGREEGRERRREGEIARDCERKVTGRRRPGGRETIHRKLA
jgi:hypothetical protein